MRQPPTAIELLRFSRQRILETLLEQLPDPARYEALLAANAIAIAIREILAGDQPLRDELENLRRICAGHAPKAAPGLLDELSGFNKRLALDIRRGRCDEGGVLREDIRAHLLSVVVAVLRECNPKYLQSAGIQATGQE